MKLQNMLIRLILAPLCGLANKLPGWARDLLFLAGGLGILGHNFLKNMNLIPYRFVVFFAINCVFLGMMILGGIGKAIKPVKFQKFLSVCWFAVGLLMLQSGIRNNMDYLPEAVLFLVAYPVLFICWSNGNHERIFQLLLVLCRIGGWLFAVGSFLLIPITQQRYPGLFTNTNMAAYFLVVAYAGVALHLLYSKLSWKLLPDIALLGIIAALNYYTNSRTGTLGMVVSVGSCLILYALTHKPRECLHCIPKIAACAAVSMVCISCLVFVFQLRSYIPLPYLDITRGTLYYAQAPADPPPTTRPADTDPEHTLPDTTDPAETQPDPTSPTFFDTSGFNDLTDKKNNHTDKTLDQYSTGRLSIWLAYTKKLNLFGHATMESIYLKMLYRDIHSTHMTILQIGYESGIFAGIFYLLFNLGSGILAIAYAIRHRKEVYALVPLTFTLVFGVLSMLGDCGVSFWYMTTFYYYLVQFPIMALPAGEKV